MPAASLERHALTTLLIAYLAGERKLKRVAADADIDALGVGGHRLIAQGALAKPVKHQHGGLQLEAVEATSLQRYRPSRPHPYWCRSREAAKIFGISTTRVQQLSISQVEGVRLAHVAASATPSSASGRRARNIASTRVSGGVLLGDRDGGGSLEGDRS